MVEPARILVPYLHGCPQDCGGGEPVSTFLYTSQLSVPEDSGNPMAAWAQHFTVGALSRVTNLLYFVQLKDREYVIFAYICLIVLSLGDKYGLIHSQNMQ